MIFDTKVSKGMLSGLKVLTSARRTFSAVSSPRERENIEGPEPDIPPPNAPALSAVDFNSLKWGMRTERSGSITTSTSDRAIRS